MYKSADPLKLMVESVDPLKKVDLNRVRKLFAALDDTRDTKRLQLLELPFAIFNNYSMSPRWI